MSETMRDLVDHLLSVGLATPDTIKPCSPAEVEEVRQAQRVDRLPTQYEEFLLTAGRRAGDLLRGTDFFYPAIVRLADEMRELLVENKVTHLMRPGSVIVGMHGGYQLYWVEPGDPSGTTYFYAEGEETPQQSWPTLLDCLVFEANEQIRIREQYKVYNKETGEWVHRDRDGV